MLSLTKILHGVDRRQAMLTRQRRAPRPLRLEALEARELLSAGDLDPTFGVGGKVVTSFSSTLADSASDVIIQPNGRIVAVGSVATDYVDISGVRYHKFALARYNSNGSLDGTFGSGGRVTTSFSGKSSVQATAAALQPDGKIVVVGNYFTNKGSPGSGSAGWVYDFAVARYNSNGTLDKTFDKDGLLRTGIDSPAWQWPPEVAIQGDGKIVVAGGNHLFRYNSNGSLDASFGSGGEVVGPIGAQAMALQSDGKIVKVSEVSVFRGNDADGNPVFTRDMAIARYNTNGTLDTTFGGDGVVTTEVADSPGTPDAYALTVTLQSDGRIVVGGAYKYDVGEDTFQMGVAIVRYNSDGSLDATFDTDGIVTLRNDTGFASAAHISLQADGKILTVGGASWGSGYDYALLRLNSNGSIDSTFGGAGVVGTDLSGGSAGMSGMAIQTDSRIVVAGNICSSGSYSSCDFVVARHLGDDGVIAATSGVREATPLTASGTAATDAAIGQMLEPSRDRNSDRQRDADDGIESLIDLIRSSRRGWRGFRR